MTIDLQSMKALAERLAGDVMNQLERDGCANKGNLAETLLAALVLEAANKPIVAELSEADVAEIEKECTSGAMIRHVDLRPRPLGDMVNKGEVHIACLCPACKEKRKQSLCGCIMCEHHTEPIRIARQASAEYANQHGAGGPIYPGVEFATFGPGGGGGGSNTSGGGGGRAFSDADIPQGCEIIEMKRGGLTIRHRADIKRTWWLSEIDALFAGLDGLVRGGGNGVSCIPLDNLDMVLVYEGAGRAELITGLEAMERGVK